MIKKKVIMLGGGGFAKEMAGVILRLDNYELIGFLDDNDKISNLLGKPYLGKIFPVPENTETKSVVLGIGHVGRTVVREKIIDAYEKAGFHFETIIAPTAVIAPMATIGKGVCVADGAVIEPATKVGDYAIINSMVFLGHDSTVGRNTHLCPGAMIAGNVKIGSYCLFGIGSASIHGITVGDHCLIPAGLTVYKNLKDNEHVSIIK